MFQGQIPIISNQEVMPGIHLMWLAAAEISGTAQPGQFVMITCDNGNERLLRRPISVYQVQGSTLAILFSRIGPGTEWLAQRHTGEKIDLLGPLGNGFSVHPDSQNLLLIAGGIGVAPLCFLAAASLKNGLRVRLLAGAKTADQICPSPLIPSGCELLTATEDGSAGSRGLVTSLLPEVAIKADQVFICGPLPMFKAIARDYRHLFPNKSVQVSLEVRMGCGLGFCYACTIKTRRGLQQVCHDGPVFELTEVEWNELP